jgi:PAS domain S-box-containing protein
LIRKPAPTFRNALEGKLLPENVDMPTEAGDRFFKELADFAPVLIWRSGADALCDWFNKPWLDFVGRAMEQEVGNGWAENVHPDDFDRCLEIYLSAFESRQPFTMAYRLRRHDGVYRDILDNGNPFYREGDFAGYFGSCIDVTDFNALKGQLRQSHKMQALGQLTGGVAHDINNLLMIVSGSAETLRRRVGEDPRALRALEAIDTATRRGSDLTRHLLSFAGRQRLQVKIVPLAERLAGARDLIVASLPPTVLFLTDAPDELWPVAVDQGELDLALLNLALNARDAMPDGGELRFTARNTLASGLGDEGELEGEFVAVQARDTGSGIAPDILPRIFEPFFTTKAVDKGTGLGLSQVYGFARQAGGDLKVDSRLGEGATFTLYLPRARAGGAGAAEDVAADDLSVADPAIVLVVEDNPEVAEVAVTLIEQLGHRARAVGNAADALAVLQAGQLPDVVFTDIVMAGPMDGLGLARVLRERHPGLPVILTTGYSRAEDGALDEFDLINKPYAIGDLDLALRRALRRREVQASERLVIFEDAVRARRALREG